MVLRTQVVIGGSCTSTRVYTCTCIILSGHHITHSGGSDLWAVIPSCLLDSVCRDTGSKADILAQCSCQSIDMSKSLARNAK